MYKSLMILTIAALMTITSTGYSQGPAGRHASKERAAAARAAAMTSQARGIASKMARSRAHRDTYLKSKLMAKQARKQQREMMETVPIEAAKLALIFSWTL